MIELYQFAPAFGLPNASPFCLKLETWLRMADLEYRVHQITDTRRSPSGKAPWIVDNGTAIADSSLIIEHLKRTRSFDPELALLAEQRALALTVQRLLEEHLYFAMVHYRWCTPAGWAEMKPLLSFLPGLVRPLVTTMIRRKLARDLNGQGIGRLDPEVIVAEAKKDLTAVSDLLATGPFLFGDQPTTIDTTIFGTIANILWAPMEASVQEHCRNLPNLVNHSQLMKDRFFPD